MHRKALTLTALLVSSLSANAALYDRGNGLIYDDVLDITWLQAAFFKIDVTIFSFLSGLLMLLLRPVRI